MTTINFTSLEEELFVYEEMTEKEAQELYNVDYKEEALQYIKDYWI